VLLGTGSIAWNLLTRHAHTQLDRELAVSGHRLATRAGRRFEPEKICDALATTLGSDRLAERIYALVDSDGQLLLKSPNWPADLGTDFRPGEALRSPQPQFPQSRGATREAFEARFYKAAGYRIGPLAIAR
jgi:hypothetical protein